jgi:hypothetical protein
VKSENQGFNMKAMRVEMGFLDRATYLAGAVVLVQQEEETSEIKSERGESFHVTRQFEEPASRLFIRCFSPEGEFVFRSAMRMGNHNSEDWEKIVLAEPYELCFRCAIVNSENPDWATQPPMLD